ncbi:hypothetical protein [Amycolatopsis sp. lyj-109]|uniref:hypothetical protein n=1 Tax=Amycolatopsis sp. lyj-109 TaxID=2789287 RepID=UPI00397C16FD
MDRRRPAGFLRHRVRRAHLRRPARPGDPAFDACDNYFWLLPGESRPVRVEPRRRVPNAKLLVEAYNVAANLS